ncbi:MAG: GH25 family lysozyme [Muribaculaceae bacterium]
MAIPVQAATKKSSKKAKQETTETATSKSSKKKSSKKKETAKNKKKQSGNRTGSRQRAERAKQQSRRKAEQVKVQSSRESTDYDGIDVSSYQKDIDWDAVCNDKKIRFVYVKATEGATYTSPHFRYNIENARKHGLKVGSYHFLRTTSSLRSQFENFTRAVKPEEQDLVPLIDIEQRGNWTPKQIVDSLDVFIKMVSKHYNCRPMIYTMTSFYNKYLASHFKKYPLFIARYSESAPELNDGANYTLWQYTDQGTVKGIDHAVDMCRFAKDKRIADILLRHRASKLSDYDKSTNAIDEPKPETPSKFKNTGSNGDTTQIDLSKLSKKERKEREKLMKEEQKARERIAKEQKKREERERKEREKALERKRKERARASKDSIEAAKKHRKDSIEAAKKRDKAIADSLKRADNAVPKAAKENATDSVAAKRPTTTSRNSRGKSYKKQYSTRRDKE